MSSVQEIERAIETLKPEEFHELIAWLDEHNAPLTDARIARDIEEGRLDQLILNALEDKREGRTTPL